MQPPAAPRLLLCGSHEAALEGVRRILEQSGHAVRLHCLGRPDPDDLATHNLLILDSVSGRSEALAMCRRVRAALAESFIPILFLTGEADTAARLASLEGGADACLLRPFADAELLAQVRALLRIKMLHDRLTERTAEVSRLNRRLQLAYQQIDEELELAHRIQLSFLPQTLPDL